MKRNELILLGKIIKLYGHQGDVVIALDPGYKEDSKEPDLVFIMTEGIPVPFFISRFRQSDQTIIASFRRYESEMSVREFIGCEVMVKASAGQEKVDTPSNHGIEGFSVSDDSGRVIGLVTRIESFPMQVMMVLEKGSGGEIFIPFNEAWIVAVDINRKKIVMALPDGLADLNQE